MISLKELLKGADFNTQSSDVKANLLELMVRVNKLRQAYGKPMIVTSGLRTRADQIRIYKAKGVTDLARIPFGSQHIQGGACDFADSNGELKAWVKQNVALLESVGLWCEALEATPTWLHVQIVPPKSGVRFFKP